MKSRKAAWVLAWTFPLWFVPLWLGLWRLTGTSYSGLATASGGLLAVMVLVSAYTDSQYWRIPNWATYVGTLWALAINACQSLLGNEASQQLLGAVGIGQSLLGWAVLFAGLLVVFVFSGGGAGDVKLGGAIGSYLGLRNGLEAVIITYVSCALIVMIQTAGKSLFPRQASGQKGESGGGLMGTDETPNHNPLRKRIPLAPFFALGAIIILMRETGFFEFSILGE